MAKSITARLVRLTAQIIILLLVAEFGVRMFAADKIVMFPRFHTDAKYGDFTVRKLRPNTVFWHTSVDGTWRFQTNAQGYRDDHDYVYEKPDGSIRIITLGDSTMAGFEVRQDRTFSTTLERYLNAHNINNDVINTGVSGYGVAEELVVLENEAIKYDPDFVVLAFYANDFQGNLKSGLFTVKDGELVVRNHEYIPGVRIMNVLNSFALLRWLSENSYLYSYGLNTSWELGKKLLYSELKTRLKTEFALTEEEVDEYRLELATLLIKRMHKFCQDNGIHLIIMDIPKPMKLGEVRSSVPPEFLDAVISNSDTYLGSQEVFKEAKYLAELHVPHGHRHISEFAHLTLAVEAGKIIRRVLAEKASRETGNPDIPESVQTIPLL